MAKEQQVPTAPWMDSTYRMAGDLEVNEEPDGSVELAWSGFGMGRSSLSVIVTREHARQMFKELGPILYPRQVEGVTRD